MRRMALRCEHEDFCTTTVLTPDDIEAGSERFHEATLELAAHVVDAHGYPRAGWSFSVVEVEKIDGEPYLTVTRMQP